MNTFISFYVSLCPFYCPSFIFHYFILHVKIALLPIRYAAKMLAKDAYSETTLSQSREGAF